MVTGYSKNKIYYTVISICVVLLAALSYLVWDANETLGRLNQTVYEYMIYSEASQWTAFWRIITAFGGPGVLVFLTLVSTIYFYFSKYKKYAYLYITGMVGGVFLTGILKYVTSSERPNFIYAIEETFSFPSGHTTMSTLFVLLTGYIYAKEKKHAHKKIIFLGGLSISILIASSRMYLGEHWISDIAGGYLLAILWFFFCIYFFDRRKNNNTKGMLLHSI